MNIFLRFFNRIIPRINTLSGKAVKAMNRPRPSPLADRLLADALRLADIPSPTHQEEQRAAFILERLANLGISPQLDEHGNILVRISARSPLDNQALLLFSDMGSSHWHPLDSLTRLDSRYARGAGLADILGCAALLSVAEALMENRLKTDRDVVLLFAAGSLDDPEGRAFFSIFDKPSHFPCAAIGIRGLTLGSVVTNTQGIYRIRVSMGREQADMVKDDDEASREDGPDTAVRPETANQVVDTLISTARKLSGITWDSKGTTRFYIRRIEAGTGFGHVPQEGILEIELESSDGVQLEMAMNTVRATAENAAKFSVENPDPSIKTEVNITSFIPVGAHCEGEQNNNPELFKTIRGIMKDLHIRLREENGADPSAILSNRGIPSFSIGIAQGWEGLNSDTIDIASIEKGRQLIEALITRMSAL